jgi:DNA-binding MarR family transcriptional regulator
MKNDHWKLPAEIAGSTKLTGNEKILYAYLLTGRATSADPNTQAIAETCGVDKTTTLLSIKGLERAKLIKVTRTTARKLKRMHKIEVLRKKPGRSTGRKKKRK